MHSHQYFRTLSAFALATGLVVAGASQAVASPKFVSAERADLGKIAREVPNKKKMRVADLKLEEFGTVQLDLERFSVFTDDAVIAIGNQQQGVKPPEDAYFRGRVSSLPNSVAVIAVTKEGKIRGVIQDDSRSWVIGDDEGPRAGKMKSRRVRKEEGESHRAFQCGADHLPPPQDHAKAAMLSNDEVARITAALPANVRYTARMAIETDYEFYARFGNQTKALQYIGDLIAWASAIYEREVNTNLVISYSRLWPNGASSDPWNATDTSAQLDELQSYWRNNMSGVKRTLTHMMSGKSTGGGVAYLQALCSTTYGYGVSADLSGSYNGSNIVWDNTVVAHEIGHNFASQHTQDYCGIGGNSSPVDLCYTSSSCGSAKGLPGINSLSGGSTANRPGTLMSYCHLQNGGNNNIAPTFGKDHPYGIAAHRVPTVMYNFVVSTAASNPTCLALEDAGGGGDTGGTAPAAPSGASATAASSSQVNLKWTDNSTNESGFKIERKTGTSGTWSQISSAASNATSFVDSGLTAGTTYVYRVRATNATGDSAYSNEASVTTQQQGTSMPDLVISNMTLSPSSPYRYGTFSVTVTVTNRGGSSSAASYLDVWSNLATAPSCPADGNKWVSIGTLAAGASKTFTISGLSAGSRGTKTARAFVDSYCEVNEANESNNQMTRSYTVR